MANIHDPRLIGSGKPNYGAMLGTTGEAELFEVPPAPKRSGSATEGYSGEPTFDYWWKDCGRVVSVHSDAISQHSTQWTKDLRRWTREAERAEQRESLRQALYRARMELDFLSTCLAETPVGRMPHKRRKTAEMNARYVRRGGKRKYVGKKVVDARKAKRAAAARDRRAREWIETHVVDLQTDVQVMQ